MIKFISILTSALLMVQSFNSTVEDLMQFDELIAHAVFHKKEYGDSFLVFLSKHYGSQKTTHESNHKEEKDTHEDLPFNHHGCSHHLSSVYILQQPLIFVKKIEFSIENPHAFYYTQHYNSLFRSGVFQPPRLA